MTAAFFRLRNPRQAPCYLRLPKPSVLYLQEGLKWNNLVGFLCNLDAIFFVFKKS
jgi:hypothetical protein